MQDVLRWERLKGSAQLRLSESKYVASNKNIPEDHWSCIAHLSAEDILKSAIIEEKKFKHSPRVSADNPLGPKF